MLDHRNGKVGEFFRLAVETIHGLLTADPQHAIAILEQGLDVHAAEAVRIASFMHKDLEGVAVEPVQSDQGAEPHEAQIVLHDIRNSYLRKPLGRGDVREANIRGGAYGYFHGDGIDVCLRHFGLTHGGGDKK
jgi:hypothetical protein